MRSKRQQENVRKFTTPTNVHLQVYDGMPHVLTVFGYTDSVCLILPFASRVLLTFTLPLQAGHAYRSIAQFVKHVTHHTAYLGNFPFPKLYKEVAPEESTSDSDSEHVKITRTKSKSKSGVRWFHRKPKDKSSKEPTAEGDRDLAAPAATDPVLPSNGNTVVPEGLDTDVAESDKEEGTSSLPKVREQENAPRITRLTALQRQSDVIMLRERVDVHGQIRPMEPMEEIHALRIPPGQIGLIKEAPVRRWLQGQEMWDEQFKSRAKKVLKKRKKLEEKAERIVQRVTRQGLVVDTEGGEARTSREQTGGGGEQDEVRPTVEQQGRKKSSRSVLTTSGIIDENRRFGPLDLDDENPPPSAIAKRRDTVSRIIVLPFSLWF